MEVITNLACGQLKIYCVCFTSYFCYGYGSDACGCVRANVNECDADECDVDECNVDECDVDECDVNECDVNECDVMWMKA